MTLEVNEVPKSAIELKLAGLSEKSSIRLESFDKQLQIADKFADLDKWSISNVNAIFAKYLTIPTSSNIA